MKNVAIARKLRNGMTDTEKKLWYYLRRKQLLGYKFRRQCPLDRYVVDFVCFEKKLIVELDGGQHTEQIGHDEKRTRWLMSQGFRVLRFWNHEVFEHIEAVGDEIVKALTSETSLPPP